MTTPLSLSDDEYAAVMQVAGPIHPTQRDDFLITLAEELQRHPVTASGSSTGCALNCSIATSSRRGKRGERSRCGPAGPRTPLNPRRLATAINRSRNGDPI
jgi:hypothetical protein